MIKVSELTGKPVISLAEAQNLGYISGSWFDGKLTSAKTAEILSDSDDAPERRYVALKSLAVGDDAAVVRSAYLAKESNMQTATAACPINSQCYNQDGKSLGYVCDVILSGDKVTEIICEKASFAPSKLLALGNALCVFNDSDKPIKPPAPARRKKTKAAHPAPNPAPNPEPPQNFAAPAPNPEPQQSPEPQPAPNSAPLAQSNVETPATPQSVTVTRTPGEPVKDYGFLMGKPVHSDIISHGRVLIPAGSVVDENVIEYARRENKLVQLALQAY